MTRQQIEIIVAMYKNGDSYAGISRAITRSSDGSKKTALSTA